MSLQLTTQLLSVMQTEHAILFGQIETSLDFAELSGALSRAGVASRTGESAHYAGGYYLRIALSGAQLTFEKIGKAEYLISGEADSADEMNGLAHGVSEALCQLEWKHRFEVYRGLEPSRLLGYFHYQWPNSQPLN